MKYCSNCGEPISDDELKECSNCDEPIGEDTSVEDTDAVEVAKVEDADLDEDDEVEAAVVVAAVDVSEPDAVEVVDVVETVEVVAEPAPKKTGLKIAIACILGAIVLIATLTVVFASNLFPGSPVDSFRDIQRRSIVEPLISLNAAFIDAEQEPFSTDIIFTASVDGGGWDIAMVSAILEQFAIEIQLDMQPEGESLLGLGLIAFGEEFLSAMMTFTDENMGLYIPAIGAFYSIDFESLYALMDMDMDAFAAWNMDWSWYDPDESLNKYWDIILSAVNSDNLVSTRETVELFDGRETVTNATVYTFTPSEDVLHDMLTTLIQEMLEDEDFFLIFDQPQLLDLLGFDSVEAYWEFIRAEAEADIAIAAAALAEGNFTWRTATAGRQLILQELSFTYDGELFVLRYEGFAGAGGARTDWVTLEGFGGMIAFHNEMTRNGDDVEGVLDGFFQEPRFPVSQFMTITYELDLGTESILGIPYGRIFVEGFERGRPFFSFSITIEAGRDGGTDHLVTIYGLESIGIGSLTINMHSTDEPSTILPPRQRPIDLSGMSADAILDILEDLIWDLEWLIGGLLDFGPMFGMPF